MSEGLFYFCVNDQSPLRFGISAVSVAEEALGRQVSEHRETAQQRFKRRYTIVKALLVRIARGFLGACAASCSCLQEGPIVEPFGT